MVCSAPMWFTGIRPGCRRVPVSSTALTRLRAPKPPCWKVRGRRYPALQPGDRLGWFRWFEKPIFWLLTKLFKLVGNFGVAIILLTVIVRGIMFPVAQRQFASMAAMKAIQPKLKALQGRYKDDQAQASGRNH
jgi:membrane protein insertase Oxa1/YidC/SpoIIIJ